MPVQADPPGPRALSVGLRQLAALINEALANLGTPQLAVTGAGDRKLGRTQIRECFVDEGSELAQADAQGTRPWGVCLNRHQCDLSGNARSHTRVKTVL